MVTCKFILTRGKNKNKECGKNNCKRHIVSIEILNTDFDDIVQPIIIQENTNIGKCLHDKIFLDCDECKNVKKLGQCDICKISGDFNKLQKHVENFHKKLIICNTSFLTFKEIVESYNDRLIKCPKPGCLNEKCNVKKEHMEEYSVTSTCIHTLSPQNTCEICVVKLSKNRWKCNICDLTFTKQPSRHILLHKTQIKCLICNKITSDLNHTHDIVYPKCPLCKYTFKTTCTDKMLYEHLKKSHTPDIKCQMNCTSRCIHTREYELYNHLQEKHACIDLIRQYRIDVNDLLYTTLKYPEQEILRRVDLTIDNQTESPNVHNIANDAWGIICSYMSIEDKFNMQFVSKRFNEISNTFVTKFEKFQWYYTHKIFPEKMTMCASLAKTTFCLTDKDLVNLIYTPKINPYYRNAAPMKMYNKQDLIRIAFRKHKSNTKTLKEIAHDKKEKSLNRQQTTQNKQVQREIELGEALDVYGLFIRDDSRVCNEYIQRGRGPNGETLSQVVDVMVEMNWYFKHDYKNIFNNIKQKYIYDDEWYDINQVSQEAKIRIIRKYKRDDEPIYNLPINVMALYNQL
jgi:hypothetical protein